MIEWMIHGTTGSTSGGQPAKRLLRAVDRIAEHTRGRPPTGVSHDDADDTVGTIGSDDAVGFDPVPILRALSAHGARAVVIGQVAGILHGSRELTGDLDLLWPGEERDAAAMAGAFASAGAELFTEAGFPIVAEAAFALAKVVFRSESAAGDCCTPRLPWGIDVSHFVDRALATKIDGIVVRYLAIDDLISMRRASSRPKDLRRIVELERLARGPASGTSPLGDVE